MCSSELKAKPRSASPVLVTPAHRTERIPGCVPASPKCLQTAQTLERQTLMNRQFSHVFQRNSLLNPVAPRPPRAAARVSRVWAFGAKTGENPEMNGIALPEPRWHADQKAKRGKDCPMRAAYLWLARIITLLVVVQAMLIVCAVAGLFNWLTEKGGSVDASVVAGWEDNRPTFTGAIGHFIHGVLGER